MGRGSRQWLAKIARIGSALSNETEDTALIFCPCHVMFDHVSQSHEPLHVHDVLLAGRDAIHDSSTFMSHAHFTLVHIPNIPHLAVPTLR